MKLKSTTYKFNKLNSALIFWGYDHFVKNDKRKGAVITDIFYKIYKYIFLFLRRVAVVKTPNSGAVPIEPFLLKAREVKVANVQVR